MSSCLSAYGLGQLLVTTGKQFCCSHQGWYAAKRIKIPLVATAPQSPNSDMHSGPGKCIDVYN